MEPQQLAQWMQKEHAQVQDVANCLRERVCAIPRSCVAQWLDDLRDQFERFRAHLQKHMAMEEHEGYMTSVLERRPTLSRQVDMLKHEHAETTKLMTSIHHELAAITEDDRLTMRDCCNRIRHLMDAVEEHEKEENLIVSYAFTCDIGTKD